MNCPECKSTQTLVIDSRARARARRESAVYRRRNCSDCGHRWKTYEITGAEYERLQAAEALLKQLSDLRELLCTLEL